MQHLTQVFKNGTTRPLYLSLEPTTDRYRLEPSQQLLLRYNGAPDPLNEYHAALTVEVVPEGSSTTLVIWSGEHEMVHPDGRTAEMDFDPAP